MPTFCIFRNYFQVPLRYLLGVYYVNMRLVMEPIKEIITSYAVGLPRDIFWNVFHPRLLFLADQAGEMFMYIDGLIEK